MFGLPATWLAAGVAICVALFFGVVEINHRTKLAAAHDAGVAVGKAETNSAAVAEAKQANEDFRQAEAETPIDADREYFKRLCAQSASCALRSKYRAIYGGK